MQPSSLIHLCIIIRNLLTMLKVVKWMPFEKWSWINLVRLLSLKTISLVVAILLLPCVVLWFCVVFLIILTMGDNNTAAWLNENEGVSFCYFGGTSLIRKSISNKERLTSKQKKIEKNSYHKQLTKKFY